ncbi:MAG TPA: energy transducer TonB [Rhizomicrobium sp.]|jgi:TonB family protein|nr:energy transducer TonB [Rhizomicrobium sp.]
MYRLAFAIALLLPAAAFAQDTAPNAVFATGVRPSPLGPPHDCPPEIFYPASAWKAHEEGTTMIAFRVTAEGKVEDIRINKSSGSAALDLATVLCASYWRYVPATQNGKPVDAPWKVTVNWALSEETAARLDAAPEPPVTMPYPKRGNDCEEHREVSTGEANPGPVILAFKIEPDGSVKDVVLQASSGDRVYDAYAASCVAGWHYVPATQNGVPVEYDWRAEITW